MDVSLELALKNAGISIVPDWTAGKQRNGSQWLFLHELTVGDKTIQCASFGDFRAGTEFSWGGEGLSPTEKKAYEKARKEHDVARREAQEAHWKDLLPGVATFLRDECVDRGEPTPYLAKKGLKKLYGSLIHLNAHGSQVTVVPMQDVDGVIWNYQRIYPEKLSKGDKFFCEGARIEGCFHLLGSIHGEGKIYVVEGFATGCSVFAALGESTPVVCAFNAGNLDSVGGAIRGKYPNAKITFAADNDAFTEINGARQNVGLIKARIAAAAHQGEVVYPHFTDEERGDTQPTDWNDAHQLLGLEAVKDRLENPDKYRSDLEPIIRLTDTGKMAKPTEHAVAFALLSHLGENILKQDQELFTFRDTHWVLLGINEKDVLKQKIAQLAGALYGSKDITNAFNYFLIHAPSVPYGVNLFRPNRFACNFKNGTLHLDRQAHGIYHPRFQSGHFREDFLTYVLPFNYEPDSTEVNHEFEQTLLRVWKDDPAQAEKIRAYKQVLGSALCPAFPNISLFIGKPASGKSTLLKFIRRLVHEQNLCSTDPTHFTGFNMETMVGKLVNVVTDINTSDPLQDHIVKMIVDQLDFRVRRKFQRDILSPLPALHAFGANSMPKTRDGASGAYQRRMLVFHTDRFQPEGIYDKEFDLWVYEQSPQGLANAAVAGLLDLCASRGHFQAISDSAAMIRRMEQENDPVKRFLAELADDLIQDKNAQVKVHADARIERKALWDLFQSWSKDDSGKVNAMGKIRFFESIERHGFSVVQVRGTRFFRGLGSDIQAAASF